MNFTHTGNGASINLPSGIVRITIGPESTSITSRLGNANLTVEGQI